MINPRGGDFYLATNGDHNLAVDMCSSCQTSAPGAAPIAAPPADRYDVPEVALPANLRDV